MSVIILREGEELELITGFIGLEGGICMANLLTCNGALKLTYKLLAFILYTLTFNHNALLVHAHKYTCVHNIILTLDLTHSSTIFVITLSSLASKDFSIKFIMILMKAFRDSSPVASWRSSSYTCPGQAEGGPRPEGRSEHQVLGWTRDAPCEASGQL